MSKHEIFPASDAKTWLHCSWSALNAPVHVPKKASTVAAADEGTRRHDLLEDVFVNNELPDDEDAAYEPIRLARLFVDKLEPGERHIERHVLVAPDCGGKPDLFNMPVTSSIATVFDFKNGKWDVPARDNDQLLTYAAAWLVHCNAEWFRLVIFQPNGLDEEDPFKQWVHSRAEVLAHRERVLRAIADRSAPKPGTWCRWCRSFQTCPVMATDAGFMIGAMVRPVESLTTSEITRILRMLRAFGDVKEVYEDALATHLKLGRTEPGTSLGPGRSYRAWNDPVQAVAHLSQHYGAKGVKPVSPAEAEKLGPAGKLYAKPGVGAHKPPGKMTVKY